MKIILYQFCIHFRSGRLYCQKSSKSLYPNRQAEGEMRNRRLGSTLLGREYNVTAGEGYGGYITVFVSKQNW
jgi:hypothetical protein